jgi:addiction module HigA family antidote
VVSLLVIRLVYIFKKATDVKTKSAAPTTVGEMLLFEFLKPLGISAYELSIKMDISYKRMIDILQNESSITEKECLSLSVIFNTDVYFWWNLHNNYNNWMQRKNIL